MAVKRYDAAQNTTIIAGIPISGFAEGSMIEIEYNSDAFELKIGVDGEGTRSRTNDNSAKITLSLMSSSSANDALSALHNLDKNSANGDGIGPLLIKDGSGNHLAAAETAWIVKDPTVEFGREVGERKWVLETDSLKQLVGGN